MSGVTDEQDEQAEDVPAQRATPGAAGWIWMRRGGEDVPEDEPPARFPDDPTVIEHHEARGWTVVDAPEDRPFVPPKAAEDLPDDQPWVDLVHPGIPGARQSAPNDPAALQGQFDAGWELAPVDDPGGDPGDERPKRAAKKTTSSRSAAEQDEKKG